jgi:hypothetical protein
VTSALGLVVTSVGTVNPPLYSGTVLAWLGFTVVGAGDVAVPVYTGTLDTAIGFTVSSSATVTPPLYTGTVSTVIGLTVTANGIVTAVPPRILRVVERVVSSVGVSFRSAARVRTQFSALDVQRFQHQSRNTRRVDAARAESLVRSTLSSVRTVTVTFSEVRDLS